jgi:hypothetical protein
MLISTKQISTWYFSESICSMSFEFVCWDEVRNQPWSHLCVKWCQKHRKQFTPPHCKKVWHIEPTAFYPLWTLRYNEFLHFAPLPVRRCSERISDAGYLPQGFSLCWQEHIVMQCMMWGSHRRGYEDIFFWDVRPCNLADVSDEYIASIFIVDK